MQGPPPPKYDAYWDTFRVHHPSWYLRTWTEEEMQALVTPKWRALLRQCRLLIQRADIYRCIVLEEYGGVYVDCDMICLKPLDVFLSSTMVQVGACHGGLLSAFISVNNGIIFAPPKAPVWDDVVVHMSRAFSTQTILDSLTLVAVLRTTGPWLWSRVKGIVVHPPELFYSLKVSKRKELLPSDYDALHESYVYHAQAGSWIDGWEGIVMRTVMTPWLLGLLVVLLIVHNKWIRVHPSHN